VKTTWLPPTTERPAFGRGTYALLAGACVVFVIYGSLVPFHYRPLPWADAMARWRVVCAAPLRVVSIADWAQNILLFIPLSFGLMAAACCDRPAPLGLIAASLVLPFCTLLASSVEFTQLFFPPRFCSLNDVAAESAGGLIGVLLWLTCGQAITDWFRRVWASLATRGWAAMVLPAYMAALVLIELLPLDLTLLPSEIYRKFKSGRVQPIPFASVLADPSLALAKQLLHVALYLPIGLLLARQPAARWQQWQRWPHVLAAGLTAAGSIEFLQLLVESRYSDSTDAITGALAVLTGWAGCLAVMGPVTRPAGTAPQHPGLPDYRWLLLLNWLALLALINWLPLNGRPDPALAMRRLHGLSLVPFLDYQQVSPASALEQLMMKVLLWVPVGALLGTLLTRPSPTAVAMPLLLAAGAALAIEAVQLFLVDRWPSVTDVLLELVGASIGLAGAQRARGLPGGRLAGMEGT